MNRDSLLSKSLFSASFLKREPINESPEEVEARQRPRRPSRQRDASPESTITPLKRKTAVEPVAIDEDASTIISHSSSSSDSSDDEDLGPSLLRKETMSQTALNRNTNQLILKLERQQSKQNRYLSKLKHINKSIRTTSRLLAHNAELAAGLASGPVQEERRLVMESTREKTPEVVEAPKKRRLIHDMKDSDNEDDVSLMENHSTLAKPPTSGPSQPRVEPKRAAVSRTNKIVPTKKVVKEIELGKSKKMDTFILRNKEHDVVFGKRPRSLLCNTLADPTSKLSDLMIATSLDGDLQFWNVNNRKNIKTIGRSHIYDRFIENICWVTPSTLAFTPPQKADEPVKMIHIGKVSDTNVEGRVQVVGDDPHENGISAMATVETGKGVNKCSFLTGGHDKSVYLWSLSRSNEKENFENGGTTRLNIKHTSAVLALLHDKFRNTVYSGGADERFTMYDLQTNTSLRDLRLTQRVSHILQSKVNPNMVLVSLTSRSEQFLIYDIRSPGYDGIKLKFGQVEPDTLSRYMSPDWHENGYTVVCGSQVSSKLNFWDIRYTGVSRNTSFTMDMSGTLRTLKSTFIPNTDTIASVSSNRAMSWLDYSIEKDVIVKSLT